MSRWRSMHGSKPSPSLQSAPGAETAKCLGDIQVAPAVYKRKRRPSRKARFELHSGQVTLWEGHPGATGFRRSEAEPETDRGAGDLLSRSLGKSFAPSVPVGARKIGTERVVKPCHCKSLFCERCGGKLGRKIRWKLLERLRNFQSVFGITLTVDPELFESPEAAYLYVMGKNGRIGDLCRALWKRGHLRSRHYFVVIEWQENSWPHWHVLVDSSFVPFGVIVELWSSNRPK